MGLEFSLSRFCHSSFQVLLDGFHSHRGHSVRLENLRSCGKAVGGSDLCHSERSEKDERKGQDNTMLHSGKELRVFAVKPEDLKVFCHEAKR